MSHARRKLMELHLAKKSHIAATPLALIGQLYGIPNDGPPHRKR
jgi:transposase